MSDKIKNELEVVTISKQALIENNIDALVAVIKKEIEDLNIDKMEVSEQNKQTLKSTRTILAKRRTYYEQSRKDLKNKVLEPVVAFEKIYNEKLKSVYDKEIDNLDKKIDEIEKGQLAQFEKHGKEYFSKKLEANPLPVANTFEDVGFKITLSINNKNIRDAVDKHFRNIEESLEIINAHEESARLMIMWKEYNYDINTALKELTLTLTREKTAQRELNLIEEEPVPVTTVRKIVNPKHEPVVQFVPQELYDFKLTISLTEENLKKLVDFMNDNEIIYSLDDEDE